MSEVVKVGNKWKWSYLRFISNFRNRLGLLKFQVLRKLKFLNKIGFLTCNSYIQINTSNAEEIFKTYDVEIYKIVEEDATKPASYLEGQEIDELQPFTVVTETVVLDATNSSFSLINNHLLDKDLNIVGGYRIQFEALPIYYTHLPSKVPKLKGTVAYLSDPQPSNYYHWMCGTLPLIRIYKKLFNLEDIDFFYVGQFPLSSFHEESLTRAGLKMSQIVQESCTADRIVAAMSSRFKNFNDPISREAYLFTKSLFNDVCDANNEKSRKRIYVKRGNVGRRKVINEAEVIKLLENYGFESVQMDNKTIKEQAEIFSQAEAIVALHGAALTNLMFIQPHTQVIELIPYGYINNCFYVLGSYAEANYFYLRGEQVSQSNSNAHSLNIYVDIQKLDKTCQLASLKSFNRC